MLKAEAAVATRVSLLLMAMALILALAERRAGAAPAPARHHLRAGPEDFLVPGPTLLEISRAHRVPHLSVCGGKARCSTCRVRMLVGAERLAPPAEAEAAAAADRRGPDVRLACQIRPTGR